MTSTEMALDAMDKAKILLCHGACFDEEPAFRLGYGGFTDTEQLKTSLKALDAYLKTLEK